MSKNPSKGFKRKSGSNQLARKPDKMFYPGLQIIKLGFGLFLPISFVRSFSAVSIDSIEQRSNYILAVKLSAMMIANRPFMILARH